MGRLKGRPAFKDKKCVTSVYLTRRTRQAMKARSRAINFSVSDLMEYCWFVAGSGATREALERFRTSEPEAEKPETKIA